MDSVTRFLPPGYGYGSGSGSGDGSGIKFINGYTVHIIDGVSTVLYHVHGNVARGAILCKDLTLKLCYVVKQDAYFAHGDTLHDAMDALREKLLDGKSEEERITEFIAEHKLGEAYPCKDLYRWHHILTGSCDMGRKQFASDHGIDIEKESMTVERFIELTRNAYGGEVIRNLAASYGLEV